MNELLLVCTALLSAAFVYIGWRLGKERLYSVIIVFLILIAAVGGKTVIFFGHETNTGNIFYASVFLATYFLIERYGRREGVYSIWVGIIWVIFFSVLVRIAVALSGTGSTAPLDAALATAFGPVTRVTFASLFSYAISQNCNVYLYLYLKKRMHGSYLWLRANIANAVAQTIDSIIFFSIAFLGVVGIADLWDVILTGFVIKVVYMMLVSPMLYLNKMEEEKDGSGTQVVTIWR